LPWGGAALGCVVNGAAGRELLFRTLSPPRGERIAEIGAGPAGLTYASLVAEDNAVTVFEWSARAGGAFRLAANAPLFQEVEASVASFAAYIGNLVAASENKGATIRYRTDVVRTPDALAGFDRIVIATGAAYRFGLGRAAVALLDCGVGRWPGLRRAFANPAVRDWFYLGRKAHPCVNAR